MRIWSSKVKISLTFAPSTPLTDSCMQNVRRYKPKETKWNIQFQWLTGQVSLSLPLAFTNVQHVSTQTSILGSFNYQMIRTAVQLGVQASPTNPGVKRVLTWTVASPEFYMNLAITPHNSPPVRSLRKGLGFTGTVAMALSCRCRQGRWALSAKASGRKRQGLATDFPEKKGEHCHHWPRHCHMYPHKNSR